MNFFENRDRARRSVAFRLLLLTTIVLSPAALWTFSSPWLGKVHWYEPLAICAVMIPFIAGGCWYHRRKPGESGQTIAEDLGAYLISFEPEENQRWVMDIVEEMAIASGSPVPLVYVLDAKGINGFAVGFSPQDSVIGLTWAATVMLNREEMQALVAHLFCQIHNKEMRADTLTLGVLTGVTAMAFILPLFADNDVAGQLFLFGAGWTYLGYITMCRITRQRKYLADAAAAQFTRNPQSVASALKKIGGYEYGSYLEQQEDPDNLPMFFAQTDYSLEANWNSPHPPLEKRIRRLDPAWSGEYPDIPMLESLVGNDEATAENRRRWQDLGVISTVTRHKKNEPTAAHVLYQTQINLSKIPIEVRTATRHTTGAQALIYQLLLSTDVDSRDQQLEFLQGLPNQEVAHFLQVLNEPVDSLDRYLRLPLFDLCIPALKQLEADQYQQFTHNIKMLIQTDYRASLMGLALLRVLNTQILGTPKAKSRYLLRQLERGVSQLLGLVAVIGHQGNARAELAYSRACELLPFEAPPLQELDWDTGLESWESAFNTLHELNPQDKGILMDALAVCIEHDGHITYEEIELMRAIANSLDCPMPARLETPSLQDSSTVPLPQ